MPRTADALVAQRHALVHAEAMLLVDDDERELIKLDAFLEQRMRADDKLCTTIRDCGQ